MDLMEFDVRCPRKVNVISHSLTIYPTLQYIPRNMHTVLLCFALMW